MVEAFTDKGALAAIVGWDTLDGFAAGVVATGVDVLATVGVAAGVEIGAVIDGFVASDVMAAVDVKASAGFWVTDN